MFKPPPPLPHPGPALPSPTGPLQSSLYFPASILALLNQKDSLRIQDRSCPSPAQNLPWFPLHSEWKPESLQQPTKLWGIASPVLKPFLTLLLLPTPAHPFSPLFCSAAATLASFLWLNMPIMLLPQGLCTCFPLWTGEYSPLSSPHEVSRASAPKSPLREALPG